MNQLAVIVIEIILLVKTFNNYKVLDVVKDTDSYKFEIICTKCENKFFANFKLFKSSC